MKRTAKSLWMQGLKSLEGICENPSLDSLVLLCFVLGLSKEEYWRDPNREVSPEQEKKFSLVLSRRVKREPIAYITEEKEFWGQKFFVDHRVLIPRPDTEILVETALEIIEAHACISDVFDIGTGSGAIGLSICVHTPSSLRVHLVDISQKTLEVARINQQRLSLSEVTIDCAHLLSHWEKLPPSSIVLANLPYLTKKEVQTKEILYPNEPKLALLGGGEKGLALIDELLNQIKEKHQEQTWIILEASSWQIPLISHTMKLKGFNHINTRQDLAGLDRIVISRL